MKEIGPTRVHEIYDYGKKNYTIYYYVQQAQYYFCRQFKIFVPFKKRHHFQAAFMVARLYVWKAA